MTYKANEVFGSLTETARFGKRARPWHDGRMNLLSLFFSDPLVFLVFIAVFMLALSIHEFSHAYAGYLLGDMTAKRMGRLTLNPFAHIDPLGFLALITIGFGWGKPVPFNPYNLKYPRWGPVLVASAGPFSNLIFGTLLAIGYRFAAPVLGDSNLLVIFLSTGAYLNYILMLFNLIPLPPLDGSKALLAVLADERYRSARVFIETQGPYLLLGLIVVDSLFNLGIFSFLNHAALWLVSLIVGA